MLFEIDNASTGETTVLNSDAIEFIDHAGRIADADAKSYIGMKSGSCFYSKTEYEEVKKRAGLKITPRAETLAIS